MSNDLRSLSEDYYRIERVLHWLAEHRREQPALDTVAGECGLSPTHFQKLFLRWVGISPKRFIQYLTVEHAKELLRQSRSVLHTALETGLSGPGRLHDLFLACEAVTPGQFKSRGRDLVIQWGQAPSPFGEVVLGWTAKGLCHMGFVDAHKPEEASHDLTSRWQGATLVSDPIQARRWVDRVFSDSLNKDRLPVHLRGTNFQIKVWQALLQIPRGAVLSYGDIARLIGHPSASRAVAGAVGRNPVSYIIPCHRVIRDMGVISGYRWGVDRKKALLGWEQAMVEVS
jgi:AraC family transcriptional regulator of adaptative response/methylated-DNA-[protein]-cysteine methyltransferase